MGVYLAAEMQSVYFIAPADWAIGHSLGRLSHPSAEKQSVYYTALTQATGKLFLSMCESLCVCFLAIDYYIKMELTIDR